MGYILLHASVTLYFVSSWKHNNLHFSHPNNNLKKNSLSPIIQQRKSPIQNRLFLPYVIHLYHHGQWSHTHGESSSVHHLHVLPQQLLTTQVRHVLLGRGQFLEYLVSDPEKKICIGTRWNYLWLWLPIGDIYTDLETFLLQTLTKQCSGLLRYPPPLK